MFSLPFLAPWHQAPIASFPSEFLSLLLGTLVLAALACRRAPLRLGLPAISLAPLLLAALLVLQYTLGMFAYGASALVAIVFLLWAALLAVAGQSLRASLGAAALCRVLAGWLLAGALANAAVGLLQFSGAWSALGGLAAAPAPEAGAGVYGNLAQQNHFSSHLAMGLAAALWLRLSGGLRGLALPLTVLPLLAALALSGSRSSWLYLAVLAAALARQVLSRPPPAPTGARPSPGRAAAMATDALAPAQPPLPHAQRSTTARRLYAMLAVAALLLAALALLASQGWLGPQLARLTRLDEPFGPRAFAWRHAWQMALAHPWLGVGWDNFAAAMLQQLLEGEHVWGIDQYAHNLPLQLLATTGLPGLLAVLLPLGLSLARSRGAPLLAACILAILAIHSMLEQPLYYAYFLGPAALLAGAMEQPPRRTLPGARWLLAGSALVLLFGLGRVHRNYSEISSSVYAAQTPPSHALVQRLHTGSVFAPLLELALPAQFVAPDAPIAHRLAFNDKVRHFAPIAEVEFRHAALLAEAGLQPEAEAQLVRAARAYPAETPVYLARIAQLAAQDPDRYGELAAFAAARRHWR